MANEVFLFALEESGNQLKRVLTGIGDLDARPIEICMTPRETAMHLIECYIAFQKAAHGEEHEWGTFEPTEEQNADPIAAIFVEREKAAGLAKDASTEIQKKAVDFINLHDGYHIGQMVTHRRLVQPAWNSYEIYG